MYDTMKLNQPMATLKYRSDSILSTYDYRFFCKSYADHNNYHK